MNLYIGNLSTDVTEDDLRSLFAEYGTIKALKIARDNYSGTSRGFGFLELPGKAEGQKAIKELNYRDLKGKKIAVNEAHNTIG